MKDKGFESPLLQERRSALKLLRAFYGLLVDAKASANVG